MPVRDLPIERGDDALFGVEPARECSDGRSPPQPRANTLEPIDAARPLERLPLVLRVAAGEPLLRCLAEEMSEGEIGPKIVNHAAVGPRKVRDNFRHRRTAGCAALDSVAVRECQRDAMRPRLSAPAREIILLDKFLAALVDIGFEPSDLIGQSPFDRIEEAAFSQAVGAGEQNKTGRRRNVDREVAEGPEILDRDAGEEDLAHA